MPAPEDYVDWVNNHVGFSPRGQSHSDYLTSCVMRDLSTRCPGVRRALESGFEWLPNVGLTGKRHNSPIPTGDDEDDEIEPNIDGVMIRALGVSAPGGPGVLVPLTLENKTIMTAHGKARTNRHNDARSYATHVHAASPDTIAAFTIVINTGLTYRNPDAFARSAKVSGVNPPQAARTTIDLFRSMRVRSNATDPIGRCEAVFILPIAYDGASSTARLSTELPAPQPGEPFSYDWFLERICTLFRERNP